MIHKCTYIWFLPHLRIDLLLSIILCFGCCFESRPWLGGREQLIQKHWHTENTAHKSLCITQQLQNFRRSRWVSLKFFYFLMQYLRRILLCNVNRYHIVPGDFLDVINCYNEARCSRDLCPFAQELGTLVSSTSLGRIASTRRRVSWRDNRSPQGVLLPDCPWDQYGYVRSTKLITCWPYYLCKCFTSFSPVSHHPSHVLSNFLNKLRTPINWLARTVTWNCHGQRPNEARLNFGGESTRRPAGKVAGGGKVEKEGRPTVPLFVGFKWS